MNYKIYIIIITYNAMKWAEKCFSSLRKSSISVKTIVVDNGSTDGTQHYIQEHFPEVQFIQSPENLGFGKANNIGIEKAYKDGADFFYLMNQDAWIFEDSFEKMLEVYNEYPNKEEIGIISPMHLDGSEKNLDIFLDKYIAQNFENRMISDLFNSTLKPYYEISFINAAHWLLPKKTIEVIGGFNPFFFHYGEDNEYVNRIKFYKKKILLCTESKVIHDGKQRLNKVDYSKYQDLRIETKILDPNYVNGEHLELKALQNSLIKSIFMGNIKDAKKLYAEKRKIKSNINILTELKAQILEPNAFLNLINPSRI